MEERKCIIYLLTNKINNKIYIGQTWNSLTLRMGPGGCNYKNSTYLYNSIQKYGATNFEYSVLALATSQQEADYLEEKFIIEYNSTNPDIGYNIKLGGSNGKHSEETKIKIATTLKSKEITPEKLAQVTALGKSWAGKEKPELSQERKEFNSNWSKEWHKNNEHPMLNKNHTEEAKKKISESLKGRIVTEETKAKRAATLSAKNKSAERDAKIIELYNSGTSHKQIKEILNIGTGTIYRVLEKYGIKRDPYREGTTHHWVGKTHSEETKKKMSEAKLENHPLRGKPQSPETIAKRVETMAKNKE